MGGKGIILMNQTNPLVGDVITSAEIWCFMCMYD